MSRSLFIVAILAVLAAVLYVASQSVTSSGTYDLKANVTELRLNDSKILIGISNDRDEINFGAVAENMTVKKFLDLQNNEETDAVIRLETSGSISPYVLFPQREFLLKSGEKREVEMRFDGAKIGYYEGTLAVDIITPKNRLLAPLSLWK
ncbi:MAG: hypothetical protein ACP5E4_02325 [Candidatus Aenigmatarchaeota archaeon]